ncbi:carbohydrate esterase family 16 protein [Periconia macrospinosa]|uniref:Carbohydrate esterase family 16 protein n=1 Tax=Periconia macrospinosa TaxID=97972 RepID=A0A2V1EAJ5_9PLEO|nr:carbohydrate esterase family 16 protein [Periconia macrospinosa]
MRTSLISVLSLNLGLVLGQSCLPSNSSNAWQQKTFNTLVTFGDSYTDENRLGYFINHNGSAPPTGWEGGVNYDASSGGRIWARYASIYSNLNLYNYAVSGAVCSNKISPRYFSAINAPFPDILGYELPAFIADSNYTSPNGTAFFTGKPSDTIYTIWIGTNDIGNYAFLTDSQVRGKTLPDYLSCVYQVVKALYDNGARYFVLMNLAPLQLAPLYATPENDGVKNAPFWPDKPSNITEVSYRMWESVATLNALYEYRTPFELLIADSYPEAKIANFDVNALMTDIWTHPEGYLNGTEKANVTGFVKHCQGSGANQTCSRRESPDSYVWFDELHPSEQVDRVIAKEFGEVVKGVSRWAKYWG